MRDAIYERSLLLFTDVMEGHSSHILTETDQAVEGTQFRRVDMWSF